MALSFSIENILARPTYQRIKPATTCTFHYQPYPQVYIGPAVCTVNAGIALPPFTSTRKRRKRYRTIFNEAQIAILEELYETTPYPDLYQRESVAFKTGLQEERVEVWFKNRRARTRKLKKAATKLSDSTNEESSKEKEQEIEKSEEKQA